MALEEENSTARVYLSDGKGKFSINNVSDDINSYLKGVIGNSCSKAP